MLAGGPLGVVREATGLVNVVYWLLTRSDLWAATVPDGAVWDACGQGCCCCCIDWIVLRASWWGSTGPLVDTGFKAWKSPALLACVGLYKCWLEGHLQQEVLVSGVFTQSNAQNGTLGTWQLPYSPKWRLVGMAGWTMASGLFSSPSRNLPKAIKGV